jgi:POT family proton-dependent oligopeptide transporter
MFKTHPRGLSVIFFAEMWERFGFYIMMAVFVLYMDREFQWVDSKKGDLYGIFLGLVYFTPILGGWIGDRPFGQYRTIMVGSILMIIGYIALAFSAIDQLGLFYSGLLLVALGTGLFKVNMAVLVGNLYRSNPQLKDAGFNIYYMGVNLGAAIAPVAATVIGHLYNSYNLSFAAAAVGMTISLVTFQLGRRSLHAAESATPAITPEVSTATPLHEDPTGDRQRILTLGILFAIVIFFWIAFYQNGFALTLFAERSTIRSDILKPETYQFFNPFFILVLTPILLRVFTMMRRKGREPSSARKIGLGMFISGFSMLVMVFAGLAGGDADLNIMSPLWLITAYFVVTVAEILVSPMGQSFVSKVSPRRFQGLMMGFWFGATAIGSYGSGLLGKYYSSFPHHQFFFIIAGLLFLSSILVLIFMKKLNRFTR